MRKAQIDRKTKETNISLSLKIEGSGKADLATGCGFLDHMLTLFAVHGRFDLTVKCDGDTYVDYHHTVEDIGIALGEALALALGDKRGLKRYGECMLPMDEALVLTALDLSGRGYLGYAVQVYTEKVGQMDCDLVEEFLMALARTSGMTLHVRSLTGKNTHHIFEAVFKGLGRALRTAVQKDPGLGNEIPSSKGVL